MLRSGMLCSSQSLDADLRSYSVTVQYKRDSSSSAGFVERAPRAIFVAVWSS